MLNDTAIRAVKPLEKPMKYRDGGGLYLYVPTTGKKYWRLDYRYYDKRKELSLGEYPAVTLKMARERREEAKKLLAQGIDPAEHKKQIKIAKLAEMKNSFENIAREWHDTQTTDCTTANRSRKLQTLERYCFHIFGKKGIDKVGVSDVLPILKALELENRIDMAHRVKEYMSMVMRYAVATGRAEHNFMADIQGAIRPRRPVHRASITEPEKIGQLLLDIENFTGYYQTKCALQLMPMFFVRLDELRLAGWKEFDFEERLWRIPAERMKMRLPHIVPLANQAVVILKGLREYTGQSCYVFPSIKTYERPMGKATLLHALRGMGYRRDAMTVHGFRSMASTMLNELGYNRDWIERQLAHQEKNSARDAYNYAQYLNQRKTMMQEWADYLTALLEKTRSKYGLEAPPDAAKLIQRVQYSPTTGKRQTQ